MKKSIAALAASFTLMSLAPGATIIAYLPGNQTSDPGSPDPGVTATVVAPGVTATTLARGSGLGWNNGGDFNSNGWDDGTTSASAQTAGNYVEWGFTSTSPINLTTLDIRYDRSSSGPPQLEILLSANGGAFSSVFTDSSIGTGSENNAGIDLSSFTNVTSATFRLAAWGASSSAGTFDIEDTSSFDGSNGLVVSGTVVPEPTAVAFLALAGFGFLRRRR